MESKLDMIEHSPHTQKISYMLSDLNDHYNMQEMYLGDEKEHIQFKIWFGDLRNTLKTNVDMQGNVHYGELKCVFDDSIEHSKVESIIPSEVKIKRIFDETDNPVLYLVVHSSKSERPVDGQNYIEVVRELKKALQDSDKFENI